MSSEPEIAVSKLLKSWATPPVSCPIASIFWACRSADCACSRATISARSRSFAARQLLSALRYHALELFAVSRQSGGGVAKLTADLVEFPSPRRPTDQLARPFLTPWWRL